LPFFVVHRMARREKYLLAAVQPDQGQGDRRVLVLEPGAGEQQVQAVAERGRAPPVMPPAQR
jgi:hypothetical protein